MNRLEKFTKQALADVQALTGKSSTKVTDQEALTFLGTVLRDHVRSRTSRSKVASLQRTR